jgi:ABC-type glycerol-3-phosphate transport system permease component
MRNSFLQVPQELADAARVDGAPVTKSLIVMIPCVVVYVSLQRYYVRGLVSGAFKG